MKRARGYRVFWLVVALLTLMGIWVWRSREVEPQNGVGYGAGAGVDASVREVAQRVAALEARERQVAQAVWAKELQARQYNRTVEGFWDAFNRSSDRWGLIAGFADFPVVVPAWKPAVEVLPGLWSRLAEGGGKQVEAGELRASIPFWVEEGWRLQRVEFRQVAFQLGEPGRAAWSRYWVLALLELPSALRRVSLEGEVRVEWSGELSDEGTPRIALMDCSALQLKEREGGGPLKPSCLRRFSHPRSPISLIPWRCMILRGTVFPRLC